ncbi:hypothetical protein Agsp01_04410 [Agromyces sp. NBRC 114283]|nr:hypothetical protein Agsp01_04410 [Agromyces sp. NBRC 114283]
MQEVLRALECLLRHVVSSPECMLIVRAYVLNGPIDAGGPGDLRFTRASRVAISPDP